MKPSKLLRHLNAKHPGLKDKSLEYFERKKNGNTKDRSNLCMRATTSTKENALGASYLVVDRIAKAKKPFTIGEELFLPATKDICHELQGEAAVEKIAHVPLSTSTVIRRIEEIDEDIETQLLERINASPWYELQVDESTDILTTRPYYLFMCVQYLYIRRMCMRICYVHYLCQSTGAELFKDLDGYMSGQLKWSFCVGICTNGVAAMTGRLSGLTARIKEVAPESESTHCLIPREMLASRKMSPEFNIVLINVVKIINYIKSYALNSRLFEQLCEEMEAEYICLLLYIEIRWLSRGKSQLRIFELRKPLQTFLLEKKSPLAVHFSDEVWVTKLACLCDIFNLLNELNLCLQGKMTTVFKLTDKVAAFC